MSKTIALTKNQFAVVDDEDYERINAHKWFAEKAVTGKFYAGRHVGPRLHRKLIWMHREVVCAPSNMDVDHIRSDDTLDNRKSNIRVCTRSQNACNRGKPVNNTSGFKGVSWRRDISKWRAIIGVNRKQIMLGCYDDVGDAARAYNEAAKKYHGVFARLNEIAD